MHHRVARLSRSARIPLIAAGCTLAFSACKRDVPWREPLAASVVGSATRAGSPLELRSAAGPEAAGAMYAALPAATYDATQAKSGQQIYESTCARCHPPGQLDGANFALAWNSRRIYDLYSLVTNTMPQDKPGTLRDEQYVAVIAYLLERNRAAQGAEPLRPDTASLKHLRIAVPTVATTAGAGTP